MKILIFDADETVRSVFGVGLEGQGLVYIDGPLSMDAIHANADAAILSVFVSSKVTKEHIDALPKLSCIIARSTGVDHIDTDYAKEKGIIVKNVPKYGARTVAEFTFALLLTLTRRIFDAFNLVREEGGFKKSDDMEGFDLYGKTIGVVGTGAIGRNVVSIARGFGMRILMYDMFPDTALETDGARYVPLGELLAASDVISLHVPYTNESHHFLSTAQFASMKKGVILVNTARGELVDTEALLEALTAGTLAGAGLDVLEGEKALRNGEGSGAEAASRLIREFVQVPNPRVILTPHVAFYSKEAYGEILSVSLKNTIEHLASHEIAAQPT